MVEGARLESVYTPKGYRGFESLPLCKRDPQQTLRIFYFMNQLEFPKFRISLSYMKHSIHLLISLLVTYLSFGQSIEIVSFTTPLEVNPLIGGNLAINYRYTSETGSTGNHIYIGLEVLDANNTYVRTISEVTLENQQAGINLQNSVEFLSVVFIS